nr:uncharacterized protein LOC106678629 [Halyomorpha halys]
MINTSKSKVMQIGREPGDEQITCRRQIIEAAEDAGTVISRDGKIQQEISIRIKKANNIYNQICNTVVGKCEVERKVKLHIFNAIYHPNILYGSESWVLLNRLRNRITASEMKYFRKVASRTRREHFRNTRIREEIGVKPLIGILEKRQLKWFGHIYRMDEDRVPRKFFKAKLTGKRPRGRPRVSWQENVARLGEKRGKMLDSMRALARNQDRWKTWIEAPPR